MKNREVEVGHRSELLKFTAFFLFLLLVYLSASANEKGEARNVENQISISEADFKRMILEEELDTLTIDMRLGAQFWATPARRYSEEFVIMQIPFSKGFKGVKPVKGVKIFNIQREKR